MVIVRGGKKFMYDESKQKLYQVMQESSSDENVILVDFVIFRLGSELMTTEWSSWRRTR